MNKKVLCLLVVATFSTISVANQSNLLSNTINSSQRINKNEYYSIESQSKKADTTFTRGNGFIIRPELYSGLFATIGYQINPYVQLSGGLGFGLDEYGGVVTSLGIRAYTSEANWAAMFDYHIGFISIQGLNLTRHTIVGGASYKDFDFGAGLMYLTDGYISGIGWSITLGYNIRCYKHR